MARGALVAQPRAETGKGTARQLRREGKIPGTIYGKNRDAINVALEVAPLQRLIQTHGIGRPIDLHVGDEKHVALVRDVQREPVQGLIQHVDFYVVALDDEVRTVVPLVLVGEDQRPNDGGIVTQILREVEISCLPTAIPEYVEADVSGVAVGDTLTVADLKFPEGVTPVTAEDEIVLTVMAPRATAEEEAAEEADAEATKDAESAEESNE